MTESRDDTRALRCAGLRVVGVTCLWLATMHVVRSGDSGSAPGRSPAQPMNPHQVAEAVSYSLIPKLHDLGYPWIEAVTHEVISAPSGRPGVRMSTYVIAIAAPDEPGTGRVCIVLDAVGHVDSFRAFDVAEVDLERRTLRGAHVPRLLDGELDEVLQFARRNGCSSP